MTLENASGSFLLKNMKKTFDPNPIFVITTLNVTTQRDKSYIQRYALKKLNMQFPTFQSWMLPVVCLLDLSFHTLLEVQVMDNCSFLL